MIQSPLHPWRHLALTGGAIILVGLASLTVAAVGLQSAARPVRSGEPVERITPITEPTAANRLAFEDLAYEGAFRLPATEANGDSFSFGGHPLAYDAAKNSLFVGTQSGRVAEISIPQPVNSADIAALPFASFIQGFADPAEGHLKDIASEGVALSGLLVQDQQLIGTGLIYYDANNTQSLSHFVRPRTLDARAVNALVRVGSAGRTGFVAGYMAAIPPEWQSQLGGPAITGQCCVPIVSRTSWGPAAFVFDPSALSTGKNVPAQPLLYYDKDHPTLGPWEGANPTYGGTTQIGGLAVIAGTRTALFVGRNGTGAFCYGIGTANQAQDGGRAPDGERFCYDPTTSDKGQHAYPYRYQMWAYDLAELAQVHAGRRDPWSVKPYGVWPFELPTPEAGVRIGGVAYDAAHRRLFVAQLRADQDGYAYRALIHAFRVK